MDGRRFSSTTSPVFRRIGSLTSTVEKPRKIQRDGIRFHGLRFIAPTLAGYVGESITVRYDPRDLAEIRVFYEGKFLCNAICQEIAEMTVSLKEIQKARKGIKKVLYNEIKRAKQLLASLEKNKQVQASPSDKSGERRNQKKPSSIKLYENE